MVIFPGELLPHTFMCAVFRSPCFIFAETMNTALVSHSNGFQKGRRLPISGGATPNVYRCDCPLQLLWAFDRYAELLW